ncbi:MAG TPA: LCP family protein [Actinomycetota bacterium]|nr:LCP family protein [Actinomycetota bacterium]
MEAPSERTPDRDRWRSWFVAVAASLSALLGLAGGIGFGGYLWASSKVDPIPITLPDDPSATTAVLGRCAERECNYLLLGSDSREGMTAEELEHFGTDEDIGGENRADTVIVVHTEPDRKQAVILHFPRDLWVNIPGSGEGKINGAFAGGVDGGGPQLVAETVQELTGIRIHHVLYVNLAGFENIVDAMGGVPMCVDRPLFDELTGLDIPEAGCYEFNGFQALSYVRSRQTGEGCPIPDFVRIQRQQRFLRAVLNKVLHPSQVVNLPDLVPAVLSNMRPDPGLNPADLAYLASQLQGVTTGAADFRAVPSTPATIYPGGIETSIVKLVQPDADQLFEAIREGKPLGDLGREQVSTPPTPANIVVGTFDLLSAGKVDAVYQRLNESGFNTEPGIGDAAALGDIVAGSAILYRAGALEEAKVVRRFVPNMDLVQVPEDFPVGMDVAVVVASSYVPVPPGEGQPPQEGPDCG